ncbi:MULTISPECIES: glycosyl hydrolase [Flavobacteriaceae]|uniref:glycosyl hydrolase n=1 Tax=Flavobacteriaceae TaxID=49546 RepID=UPI001FE3F4F3|nr:MULTISPECIES: glycosyl hydrolase [Allomuricauda]MDC6367626.1 glycosyl hydrolase [Muricauda sp. AC10]
MIRTLDAILFTGMFVLLGSCKSEFQKKEAAVWPKTTNSTKPWTRWWWMGNSLDKENLTQHLVRFKNAGLGGVEIEPIYGIQGLEDKEIDFLSQKWVEMLTHTIRTADSLNLGVDLTLGTGWPYGGPHVSVHDAATKLVVDSYTIPKGSSIKQPMLPQNPMEKNAILNHVLAFGKTSGYENITYQVKDGVLNWQAMNDAYTLYAIYTGKTGQKVKRAAPGGAGFTLDHYSRKALIEYLKPFKKALDTLASKPRAVFNDSYEVYGTDFTPNFFKEFEQKRGYDLLPHFNRLMDTVPSPLGNRIKSDYRETLNDLLLEDFDKPWTDWANENGMKSRLQAHGSPGNLIDLYASADIPECETFGSMPYPIKGFRRLPENIREGDADPIMLKFSSSAAHVANRPLVSSETFTWLRDHFKTALSQCKPEVEDLFLNGINHIFLHGSTYSPKEAAWPGWKFYASVNFNPNNTIWKDAPSLFEYITRCQSFLQLGKPDNELLLYWPIYDVWNKDLPLFFQFKIHSLDEWLTDSPFYELSKNLQQRGWSTDFISDRILQNVTVENGLIQLPGGNYKGLVVPSCDMMPLPTLKKLIALKKEGANIIFNGVPKSVPGFSDFEELNKELNAVINENGLASEIVTDVPKKLESLQILPEELASTGLKFIRRDNGGSKIYYLVNHTAKDFDDYVLLNGELENAVIFNPMDGRKGKAKIRKENSSTYIRLQIPSGGSLIVNTNVNSDAPWKYNTPANAPITLSGKWSVTFLKGGPKLPKEQKISDLVSWTEFDEDASNFSGTATYVIEFMIDSTDGNTWRIDLGDVRESAKVWLNGTYLGTAWANPFQLVAKNVQKGKNTLKVEVTNLPANRIRAKELRGEKWQIFKEINMVNKDYVPFDATQWNPLPSGLLGPVTLTKLKIEN